MPKKKSPLTRSEIMSRVKGRDTSIELKLRKELWARGLRYRINCKNVFGKPDICFKGKKIAIFCDSEFWHGKLYLEGKSIPHENTEYWIKKFERNINRDKQVNKELRTEGWIVLRYWQKQIEKNLEQCVTEIIETINSLQTRLPDRTVDKKFKK